MNTGGGLNKVPNTEPPPPGSETFILQTQDKDPVTPITAPATSKVILSAKGVENAKKRLRAFSIQKKAPLSPIVVPKPISSGNTTVLIGKLSSVKVTPKVEDPEQKKLPKPPKPGTSRRSFQDSYTDLQKRTLAEIEDMKRKMELVELGIPLGLICPSSTSEKAMPTKAMPPIKSFLDPQKVDEIIREAKKAKMEGKEFKFNYQKLLPDYDNPFQRKKDEHDKERKSDRRRSEPEKDKDRRKSESDRHKYESRRHEHRKDDVKYKERDRDKSKATDKTRENVDNSKQKQDKAVDKETDVNLNDYLICDSWSLDNDDKNSITSPKNQEKSQSTETKVVEPSEQLKASIAKKKELLKTCAVDTPTKNIPVKIEKLQPVIDSFKFEIDPNDDEVLDIFDEDSDLEKFAHQKKIKTQSLYDATDNSVVDFNVISTKETSLDGLNDDTFLESVINEIKEDELSDDNSQDQGLVEYDISPNRDEESPRKSKRGSITPEIYESGRSQSQKSDYSEGYRSSDSFKTNESGYKSVESYRLSVEKELDDALQSNMSKSTVDSLETWSFVLKICQPLLFRHDKKKCYKETRIAPKIWYTENPKVCTCVKDRAIVYEELEMCKMSLVDRVYGCDQISDSAFSTQRNWYSRNGLNSTESNPIPLSNEWEAEDSQQALGSDPCASGSSGISGLSGLSGLSASTPQRNDEMSLDREYQRFMESVWPEGTDGKTETSRSTTPVRHEARKKKKEEEKEEEKKSKKIKLSSEGWSQESDMEEYDDKSKKIKIDKEKKKTRKRKHSSSSSVSSSLSDSDNSSNKKAKLLKKKALKKTKSKSAKRRRIGRKILKKLKEKQRKRKLDRDSDEDDGKKDKKSKKKKQQKLKKKAQKKKKTKRSRSTSSSSSETSSDSDSESDSRSKKMKRNKTKNKISKKRKSSSSDSSRSEELFDVNILNNIKTERLTDDEKCQKLMEFSPRRQKPREIINVKELQSDFVGNIHIKKEIEESKKSGVIKVVVFDGGNIEHTVDGNVCKEKSESSQDSQEIPLPPVTLPDPTQPDVPLDVSQVPTPEIPPGLPPYPQNVPLDQIPTTVPEVSQIPTPELASALPPYPRNVTPGPASDVSQVPTPKFSPVPASYPRNVDQIPGPDESNMSQCSSQESMCSVKEVPTYEKDESHLRPSSQNSNYSFNDVIASQSGLYSKEIEAERDEAYTYQAEASYEMYEQLAMAYQSDVASQPSDVGGSGSGGGGREQRIETVVRSRCGEIKCDWRAGDDDPHAPPARPSRWGLKPGEVNIVLTGAGAQFPSTSTAKKPQIYQIQSLANRMDNTGYDEAYMDMYGASDRLQYGDCFSSDFNINNNNTSVNIDIIDATDVTNTANVTDTDKTEPAARTSSLDARIDQALKDSILGEVAKDTETENDKDTPEKGILITGASDQRGSKRVSFADGYKPGQDSDVEDPPVKRRKKPRRIGCAWPCPAAHPDHVPLWDALPPPPAPPGSPPPPPAPAAPPAHLLRAHPHPRRAAIALMPNALAHGAPKYDPTVSLPAFMPPEPPPGLITLQ